MSDHELLHDFIVSYIKRHPRKVLSLLMQKRALRYRTLDSASLAEIDVHAYRMRVCDCIYRITIEGKRGSLRTRAVLEIRHEVKTSRYRSEYKRQLTDIMRAPSPFLIKPARVITVLWVFREHVESYVGNMPRGIILMYIDDLMPELVKDAKRLLALLRERCEAHAD